jgi:hypothetical protein
MNTELYNELKSFADEDKLPIVDSIQFKRLTDIYTKEVFRETLSEYISAEKPKFPLREIPYSKMREQFFNLKHFDTSKLCTPQEQNQNLVVEKYDDYKYSYEKYGLGLIEASHNHNDASNYFHNDLRLDCSTWNFKSPIETWEKGTAKEVWSTLGGLWRGVNSSKDLSYNSYIEVIRLGTYIATQFKPVVAKAIYDMTEAEKVLDTSCGWGDRLCGFYTSNATMYIGCDPNPYTFERYKMQVIEYEKLLGNEDIQIKEQGDMFLSKGKKNVMIFNCGAEDLPYDKLPKVDVAFTSPPYFSTEKYNAGGDKEENQSWAKFNEYSKWRDDFYLPVAKHCMNISKLVLINIMDPKIKKERYYSSDELVDSLQDKFLGQIGMKISRRPKSDKLFESEEEKRKFETSTYIENVWCFGDNEFDLFKHSRKATLESFF